MQQQNANPTLIQQAKDRLAALQQQNDDDENQLEAFQNELRPSAPDTGRFGLGLEGDDGGGEIVTAGTPERIATTKELIPGSF